MITRGGIVCMTHLDSPPKRWQQHQHQQNQHDFVNLDPINQKRAVDKSAKETNDKDVPDI